MERSVKATGVL